MNLSRREVFSFSLARKMLHAFKGTPLEMDMRSTLDKIAASLEGTFAVSFDALTEHMSVQAEDRVVIDPAVWEAMLNFTNDFISLRPIFLVRDQTLRLDLFKLCKPLTRALVKRAIFKLDFLDRYTACGKGI